MIKPTVGRVVLVTRPDYVADPSQKEAALIAFVHNDRMINVGGFTQHGSTFGHTSVPLLQDDDEPPKSGMYAEWMPFQKGQAAAQDAAAR